MAAHVPASLKSAGIERFALRASQLEQAKPIIAYWCTYWIVQQILAKKLHDVDQEALTYTTTAMDKLEKFKSDNIGNEAIADDVVGKAVVEEFGLETFRRADNAVKANKASRQTADTYQASATFLELLEIWGTLDPEIQKKIKYAKYHALRIAKALKAGEDPNLSNPQPEPEPEELAPPLDPNDPEVRLFNEAGNQNRQPSVVDVPDEAKLLQPQLAAQSTLDQSIHPSRDSSVPAKPRQPSVTDVPDDHDRLQAKLAVQSLRDESIHPSRAASGAVSPLGGDPAAFYSGQVGDVSPVSATERKPSIGGNYFPDTTHPKAPQEPPNSSVALPSAPSLDLPSTPADFTTHSGPTLPETPTTFAQSQPQQPKTPLDSFQAPPAQPFIATQFSAVPPPSAAQQPQTLPSTQHTAAVNQHSTGIPAYNPATSQPPVFQPPSALAQAAYVPAPQMPTTSNVEVDEEAMLKAQKHARWAISALNFEDVPTAIREFQAALQTLGAR